VYWPGAIRLVFHGGSRPDILYLVRTSMEREDITFFSTHTHSTLQQATMAKFTLLILTVFAIFASLPVVTPAAALEVHRHHARRDHKLVAFKKRNPRRCKARGPSSSLVASISTKTSTTGTVSRTDGTSSTITRPTTNTQQRSISTTRSTTTTQQRSISTPKPKPTPTPVPPPAGRKKRDIAWANGNDNDLCRRISGNRVGWYYTWSVWPVQGCSEKAEHIPMLWGAKTAGEFKNNINNLKGVRTVLGSNECAFTFWYIIRAKQQQTGPWRPGLHISPGRCRPLGESPGASQIEGDQSSCPGRHQRSSRY